MIALCLALTLALQDDPRPAPTPEAIDAAVERIESALRGKEREPKLMALDAASDVPAPKVVRAVLDGLRDDETEVKYAAIQALRWIDHPDAIEALHRTFKSNRAIKKDDELAAAVLKAIGQHADPSSIDVLANRLFESKSYDSTQARLLGLGRIRDKRSIDALIDLMKSTSQHTIDRYMDNFRLSLMVLTGTDQGPNSATWQRWWRERRKDFVVAEKRGTMPRPRAMQWTGYWGLEKDYGRAQRREDRGDDPDRRGGRGDR